MGGCWRNDHLRISGPKELQTKTPQVKIFFRQNLCQRHFACRPDPSIITVLHLIVKRRATSNNFCRSVTPAMVLLHLLILLIVPLWHIAVIVVGASISVSDNHIIKVYLLLDGCLKLVVFVIVLIDSLLTGNRKNLTLYRVRRWAVTILCFLIALGTHVLFVEPWNLNAASSATISLFLFSLLTWALSISTLFNTIIDGAYSASNVEKILQKHLNDSRAPSSIPSVV